MSVVAIPFKDEDPSTVLANIAIAAQHPRIDEVWAIGSQDAVAVAAEIIGRDTETHVAVIAERRLGRFRPGKGDAMNTALIRAADLSVDRLHFYDADITNFGPEWIWGAERAADVGFDVVRHTFPRAATDAMITWFVTKPILAIRFPGTILPRIGQPLGGELLLTQEAIHSLASQTDVIDRSDWGIDTLYTGAAVRSGFSLYEHHVSDGKRHSLYGSLAELKTMLVECFDAVAGLQATDIPDVQHERDTETPAPGDLRAEKAYDVGATRPLIQAPWTAGEDDLAGDLPSNLAGKVSRLMDEGDFGSLDEQTWEELLFVLLDRFSIADPAWEALLFRLWTGRVLNYTANHASQGYDHAMAYLDSTIEGYERNARGVRP